MTNNDAMEILAQLMGIKHVSDMGDFLPDPVTPPVKPPEPVKTTVAGKFCNKCEADLTCEPCITAVNTDFGEPEVRNFYYCTNNKCERFGLVTVVAKTTKII